MKELSITFSSEILHENSFSWSFGAVVGGECRDLRFVEPSNPEFSAIQLSIRNALSFLKDGVFFRIASPIESWWAHCKSFFIDSPFGRRVKRMTAVLSRTGMRTFRSAAGRFPVRRCAVQANLGVFTL